MQAGATPHGLTKRPNLNLLEHEGDWLLSTVCPAISSTFFTTETSWTTWARNCRIGMRLGRKPPSPPVKYCKAWTGDSNQNGNGGWKSRRVSKFAISPAYQCGEAEV